MGGGEFLPLRGGREAGIAAAAASHRRVGMDASPCSPELRADSGAPPTHGSWDYATQPCGPEMHVGLQISRGTQWRLRKGE